MFAELASFVVEKVDQFGYVGIFAMMTIESSFIPFPSEVAMIPAGVLASEGKMSFLLAFLSGTLWALFGASINYFLGKKLGSPIIKGLISKFGKYMFLSLRHYEQAETFFQKHGSVTTFNGRFIPAVRQLISIPAWVFHMNIPKFLFFTGLWAGIWNMILLGIWYVAWENKELIAEYSHEAILGTFGLIIIVSIAYYFIDKYSLKN